MNQTIYFRKDVWERLGPEPYKSELINTLLAKHYGFFKPADTSKGGNGKTPQAIRPFKTVDELRKEGDIAMEKALNVVSNTFERPQNGICKLHGTLLDINGKCTQKGHKK